jgi:hypothetical protein
MGFVLDAILKKIMIDGPVTIGNGDSSQIIDIDGREGEFSIQLDYQNGIAPALVAKIQTCNDKVNWVDVDGAELDIDSASDTLLWDIAGMGTSFIRILFTGTGSADVLNATLTAKRRH